MIIHIYTFFIISILTLIGKKNKYMIILFLLLLVILDSIRDGSYYDYYSYKEHYYNRIGEKIFEIGYNFFVEVWRSLNSYNMMLFGIASLMYYNIFYKVYKLFEYESLIIFITFTQIIPYIGVNRQILSMIIFSIGINNYLIKDKLIGYIGCIGIATLFHISSLIGAPIGIIYYFKKKYIIKKLYKILLFGILLSNLFIVIGNDEIIRKIISIIGIDFLNKYVVYFYNNSNYNLNLFLYIIRNIQLILPLLFLKFNKKNEKNKKYEELLALFFIGVLFYYIIYFAFYGKFQILIGRMSLTLLGLFLPGYYVCTYKLLDKKRNKLIFKIVLMAILGTIFLKNILLSEETSQYIYRTIFN